jgi:hypothetical protein
MAAVRHHQTGLSSRLQLALPDDSKDRGPELKRVFVVLEDCGIAVPGP